MTDAFLAKATLVFCVGVGAVALLRPSVRRVAGAQAQYLLWLLVPAVLLAAGVAALQPDRPLRWQIDLPEGQLPLAALVAAPSGPPALAPVPAVRAVAASQWVLGGWALGSATCVLVWTVAHHRLLRGRRLPAGGSAALVGVLRPRVVLPADFRHRFTAAERRLILWHERVHATRGDTRWLALALGLVAVQWFNPLAWWALRRLRSDMELACDAALIHANPGIVPVYRQALLRAQGVHLPLAATPCSTHPLVERLRMLPVHRQRLPRRGIAALWIALASGLAYAAHPAVPVALGPVALPARGAAPVTPVPAVPSVPSVLHVAAPSAENQPDALPRATATPDAVQQMVVEAPAQPPTSAVAVRGTVLPAETPVLGGAATASAEAGPASTSPRAEAAAPAAPALAAETPSAIRPSGPSAEAPATPLPPAEAGHAKLRLDYQVTYNGQVLPASVMLQSFQDVGRARVKLPGAGRLVMQVTATPYRGELAKGEDGLVLLAFELIPEDGPKGAPRLIVKNGEPARIENRSARYGTLRLDVLPRLVTTRSNDNAVALAALQRDIEGGAAPAVGVTP